MYDHIRVNYPLEFIDRWRDYPASHLDTPALIKLVNIVMPLYLETVGQEPRDDTTRRHLVLDIDDAIRAKFQFRQLTDLIVTCDASNNPPDTVDSKICLTVALRYKGVVYEIYIR